MNPFANERMPRLVKALRVAQDAWTLVPAAPETAAAIADRSILPLAWWLKHARELDEGLTLGVWMDGDAEADEAGPQLGRAALAAIRFASFADGRGLSLGALLRSRHGFKGELRAFGDILPDLAPYLHRCGFDAFVVADERSAATAIAAATAATDHYQGSVREPRPAFRRLANQAANSMR